MIYSLSGYVTLGPGDKTGGLAGLLTLWNPGFLDGISINAIARINAPSALTSRRIPHLPVALFVALLVPSSACREGQSPTKAGWKFHSFHFNRPLSCSHHFVPRLQPNKWDPLESAWEYSILLHPDLLTGNPLHSMGIEN